MESITHSLLFEKPEDVELQKLVKDYFEQGDHINALELIEDSITIRGGKDKVPAMIHYHQGSFFFHLGCQTEYKDLKFAFMLASIECYMRDLGVHGFSAVALLELAQQLGSASFYRKALKIAKEGLSLIAYYGAGLSAGEEASKTSFEHVVRLAESAINAGDARKSQLNLKDSKEIRARVSSDLNTVEDKRLRSYWASLDVESKRNFLKVSIAKLRAYVERLYDRKGLDALEQVLDSAKINRRWKFWMCRSCSQKFFNLKKFRNHLEQVHDAKFKPSTTKHMAQRVDEVWAGMISVGGWEPVDTVAAVELIKTRLELVKEFVYENGWCKDWPLAADEERRKLLKEIRLLLVLFLERKILSRSARDWMMQFLVKHLAQFEVSEHTVTTDCRLVETPQSICFLERHELSQILDLLKRIKCERVDGTELVSNLTDSLSAFMRVKEKIEFDHEFSVMLLDKRLLRGNISLFDDEGTIAVCDHNVHYTNTHPQGDDIITWLLDFSLIDESLEFPRSIRAHNIQI